MVTLPRPSRSGPAGPQGPAGVDGLGLPDPAIGSPNQIPQVDATGTGYELTDKPSNTGPENEITVIPTTVGYKELDGTNTFVDQSTKSPVTDMNHALAPSAHIAEDSNYGSITGSVRAAKVSLTSWLSTTAQPYYWQKSFNVFSPLQPLSGEIYYGVYLLRDDSMSNNDFGIRVERGADADYFDIDMADYSLRGDSNGNNQIFSDTGEPGTTIAAPWNKAYTRVIELATSPRLLLVYVEWEFLEDYGEAFKNQIIRGTTDVAYSATCLYFGKSAVDLSTDAIALPEFPLTSTLSLTGSGPWAATVDGTEAALVPPPLPTTTNERVDAVAYVTLANGGTLALDASAAWAYDAPTDDKLSGDGEYELLLTGREADTVWRVEWVGPRL